MKLVSALSLVGREALRIVLPSACVACTRELPWKDRVASCCGPCWTALPRISRSTCRSCGQPAPADSVAGFLCLNCERDPLPVEWTDAWGEYRDGLEALLRALKFSRHDFLDEALASLLEESLRRRGDLGFDALVPVPMSRARERRRGYNQSELLARALSRRVAIPCDMTLLARGGKGTTQSTLPRRDRAANVRHAFAAEPAVQGKSILIIDDICTTGETLRACASALLHSGAERVCALVVAKAT
jgi:ComF family protein